jgi:hypothetical protein
MAIELTTATAETLSGIREALSISTSSKPAKDEADVLNLESYNGTIMGNTSFPSGTKFQTIADEGAGSLDFSVFAGTINGSPICPSILGNLLSITVNASNLELGDDGRGAYYSNYINYLNEVFEKLGLNSTVSGGGGSILMKYYRSENFDLIFKESASNIIDTPDSTVYWRWKTMDGLGVVDSFSLDNKNALLNEPLVYGQHPISLGAIWNGSLL